MSKNKYGATQVWFHPDTFTYFKEKPLIKEDELIRFDSVLECRTYMAILRWGKYSEITRQSRVHLLPAQGNYAQLGWKVDFKLSIDGMLHPLFIEAKGESTREFLIKLRLFKYFYPQSPILFVTHSIKQIDKQHKSITSAQLPKFLDMMIDSPKFVTQVAGIPIEV